VDLTHKDATTKAQSQSQEKEVYNSERSSKNVNDSADKRQTEIECDRQKEMLAVLFNPEE
jgi:hypothetical protein